MFGGIKATAFVFGGVYASKKAKTAGWEDVALNISKDETTSSYNVNGRVLWCRAIVVGNESVESRLSECKATSVRSNRSFRRESG